ncbi:AraC family transcriptional regulator [Paenibacillus sp. MMS20-IR301]|uniref:helix-turn-helix transcriptional regulator n=1 Tax=Paenibacillus sp. MMS20-IR301 TaxID=2895946 RepID=UPI0028E7CA34|nr:AraC family transcriptional regulator [Paenibacillus sp. MMS20-IR301]WNS45446.1 AraC family transcriptional regulator [Paenibacillus sp. MMS20-IR301]
MKQHYVLPQPAYTHYVCYPEMLGHYSQFPQHAERRSEGDLNSYNLHMVYEGEGYVFQEGERITMKRGSGFLFPRGAYQQYGSDPGQPWDVRWVHFTTVMPLPMLEEADQSRGYFFTFDPAAGYEAVFEEMYLLSAAYETRSEPRLSTLLYEILVTLMQNSQPLTGSVPLEIRHSIRRAADMIHAQCERPWTLEAMARLAGYSSYHFLRLFRSIMGKTPNRYLSECRMARAKLLLAATELPVAQIALQSGFHQSSYFIKVFRQLESMPPNQYRRLFRS